MCLTQGHNVRLEPAAPRPRVKHSTAEPLCSLQGRKKILLFFLLKKGDLSRATVHYYLPGRIAQSVTCLATDVCLTADPGVASSIPARSHTFMEIDHEIISTVILLPSADSFKKDCCQLQAKVCAQITG